MKLRGVLGVNGVFFVYLRAPLHQQRQGNPLALPLLDPALLTVFIPHRPNDKTHPKLIYTVRGSLQCFFFVNRGNCLHYPPSLLYASLSIVDVIVSPTRIYLNTYLFVTVQPITTTTTDRRLFIRPRALIDAKLAALLRPVAQATTMRAPRPTTPSNE